MAQHLQFLIKVEVMTPDANPARKYLAHFENETPEILSFIRWLVEQESSTRVSDATTRLAENLGERVAALGAEVEFARDPCYGTTLCACFASQAAEDRELMIVGHLDTVWPIGTVAARPFRCEGDRAYGPGVFDMKGGVALAFHAIRAVKQLGRLPRPVTLVMTCDEESGSPFSRSLIEERARRASAALVLEPPIPGGKVKTARKGVGEFELLVRGRSAHAGNDPDAGINAITELAHQILAIQSLNNCELGTTLTVGVITGGVNQNVIPAEARALIDMRYQSEEEGLRVVRAMAALQPVLEGAALELRGGINRPPMVRTAQVAALFEQARELAAEIGFDLQEGSVGGGSDGNFIAALGVPVLDGLGVDGQGAHAEHEHIIVSDIPRRAALLARLIETL